MKRIKREGQIKEKERKNIQISKMRSDWKEVKKLSTNSAERKWGIEKLEMSKFFFKPCHIKHKRS